MPETNDQIVQQARDAMREQILQCSQKAAQKIAAKMKGSKKLICGTTREFDWGGI